MAVNGAVEIKVTGEHIPDYHLHIALMNNTGCPLTTYTHMLPWVGQTSLLLVAVKTDAVGTVLEKRTPIDDPGPGVITIQANETLTGDVNLSSRFPGLRAAVQERDVAVFWSYQFPATDETKSQRVGGYVLFPRSPTP